MALGSMTFGTGVTSGIDWQAMTNAIINAERQPVYKLQDAISGFNKAKSAFTNLSSALSDMRSKLQAMRDGGAVGGKKTTISDVPAGATNPFSATTTAAALAGTYKVQVIDLAQAKRVRSAGFDEAYAPVVSDGRVTIKSGSNEEIVVDVSAASGNNTLQAIADSINNADKGVSAGLVSDGEKWLLVVKSEETGKANDLVITDTTNLGLTAAENVLADAKDAKIDVDGIIVTSASNTIDNAIAGVGLTLTAKSTAAVTLQVAEDVEGTKQALRDFVTSYNKINDIFQAQFGSSTSQRVQGNGLLRNIQSQVTSLLTSRVTGVPEGRIDSLAELGLEVADATGALKFKEATFDELVKQGRFDEVKSVLLSGGSTSDTLVTYMTASPQTKAGAYAVSVTQAALQAQLQGSTAIGAGLSANETLTITLGEKSATVDLLAGDTLSAVITKINDAMGGAGLGVRADANGGALRLRSSEYGSSQVLKVVSTAADASDGNSTGIGTTERSNTGRDVAGTIGGVAAKGAGRDLTGAEGSDAAGLVVRVYATEASIAAKGGSFGSVGYSQGMADQFISTIKALVDPLTGTIASATKSFDTSIKNDKDRIQQIEDRLEEKRERLTRQFAAAEQAVSELNRMMASMNAQAPR